MGLFNKMKQRITISGEAEDALKALASELSTRRLKDTKVSSVKPVDDQWQCTIQCKQAEVTYLHEVLPVLYNSIETQSFEAILQFDDESEIVNKCPTELLVSFDLESRYAFGDKSENEFIQKLHRDILQSPQDEPAAVAYYIVSGAAVTMCMPCANPEAMERTIKNKLEAFKIKRFMVNAVDRERA